MSASVPFIQCVGSFACFTVLCVSYAMSFVMFPGFLKYQCLRY